MAPRKDRFQLTEQDFSRTVRPSARMTPSPQQQEIYRWVRTGTGNLIINAVAGSGKTTTIIEACALMHGNIALAAYNKAIATEIGMKLEARGSRAFSGTFHSFGYRAWKRAYPNVITDRDKVYKLMQEYAVPSEMFSFVMKCVSLAKQRAFGVLTPFNDNNAWQYLIDHYDLEDTLSSQPLKASVLEERIEEGLSLAQQILKVSVDRNDKVIDFDDMIHAPLIADVRVYQNDWVLVDECQDTNPSRRALAKKMLKVGGRAIFVGDRHQAIYGFTGADNDSMEIIAREFGCAELPLTVTYRCPKTVVAHAQQWVKHIEAHETAPDGQLVQMPREDFDKLDSTALDIESAVLCRYTKPLVELAFSLIKRRIPCHVEGRDIGASIVQLTKRWSKAKTMEALRKKLEAYKEREVAKFMTKGQEQKAESVTDRVDTLFVIMDSMPADATIEALRDHIMSLFGDTAEGKKPQNLTLSTVHRSKGREWNRVYLLGRKGFMPSKFARQDWQRQQEINLIYVAVTRAKQILIEVEG